MFINRHEVLVVWVRRVHFNVYIFLFSVLRGQVYQFQVDSFWRFGFRDWFFTVAVMLRDVGGERVIVVVVFVGLVGAVVEAFRRRGGRGGPVLRARRVARRCRSAVLVFHYSWGGLTSGERREGNR